MRCVCIILWLPLYAGCRTPSAPPTEDPAGTEAVRPNLNAEFKRSDLDVDQWRKRFEREGREIYDRRREILEAVRVQPGDAIADVGAGSGLFTLLFAEAAGPQGKVYAVEISEPFLELIGRRARAAGWQQVETVRGTADSTQLPRRSVNKVFLCDTYHHLEAPQRVLASIHQALRPNGELIVIDFKKIPGQSSEWILNHVRATQAVVTREIQGAGFAVIAEVDLLQENYFLRFRKVEK